MGKSPSVFGIEPNCVRRSTQFGKLNRKICWIFDKDQFFAIKSVTRAENIKIRYRNIRFVLKIKSNQKQKYFIVGLQ